MKVRRKHETNQEMDFMKVRKVIFSCENHLQMMMAQNMIYAFGKMYKDIIDCNKLRDDWDHHTEELLKDATS